ncbi:monocarboxylate transporter 13-like isoform X1 [Montipora foliosa]|uniref:monocarboxylate transporter 13-like isoform X1 n=2 Tax=Montipora foliosa TaxID=591990 RepID=UPI0035F157D4
MSSVEVLPYHLGYHIKVRRDFLGHMAPVHFTSTDDSCSFCPLSQVEMADQRTAGKRLIQVVTCEGSGKVIPFQDSCWSWVVCFAGVVSNIIICGFTFSYGILFPALLEEFQQGKADTAWAGSIAMMGMGLFGPVIGKLYHRFGARIVTFFGSLICVISLLATSKVSSLYVMFVTYGGFFGFGSCGVVMITYIAVPRYFMKWRSMSLGLIAMGPGGGLFIMSPLVQVLHENFGWRGTFLAMSGITSVTLILVLVYKPITLESDKEGFNKDLKHDKKFWDISILKHKKFIICTTSATIICLGHYTPTVHMVRYLEEIGFSEVKASRLYIYSGLASLLIRPVIGRFNDITVMDPCYIYAIAAAAEGLVTFFLPMATSSLHFVLFFVVYGLADGTIGCGLSIAVLKSLPERLCPLGFGVFQCVTCITAACGPALGGYVADLKGSYVPVFRMVGSILVLGAAILVGVFCIKKSDTPSTKREIHFWEEFVVVEKCSVV